MMELWMGDWNFLCGEAQLTGSLCSSALIKSLFGQQDLGGNLFCHPWNPWKHGFACKGKL